MYVWGGGHGVSKQHPAKRTSTEAAGWMLRSGQTKEHQQPHSPQVEGSVSFLIAVVFPCCALLSWLHQGAQVTFKNLSPFHIKVLDIHTTNTY